MRLTNISARQTEASLPEFSPAEMLLDCHVRLRHFLQLSRTLAGAEDAPEVEIAEAAHAIRRYFLQALPLHEADEEQSVLPRLQASSAEGDPVREACLVMVDQHRAVQELVPELLSLCETIERRPARLAALAGRMRQVNDALAKVFEAHIQLEESVIFPALGSLSAAELETLAREMFERRRIEQGTLLDTGTAARNRRPKPPRDGFRLVQ